MLRAMTQRMVCFPLWIAADKTLTATCVCVCVNIDASRGHLSSRISVFTERQKTAPRPGEDRRQPVEAVTMTPAAS